MPKLPHLLALSVLPLAVAPARAQSGEGPAGSGAPFDPVTITAPPEQRLHADEDDDRWLGCSAEVLPYLEGVVPAVRGDGSTTCRYEHVRHLALRGRIYTLALERSGSEHEDHASLEESVYFLDEAQHVFAQVEQLDIEQYEEASRIRVRRFRPARFVEGSSQERAGLCIETIEETGPGSLDSWRADSEGRPWRPTRRYRAVDAWVLDDDTSAVPTLRRRAAYDGLCPARGYARFVDVGPREMSNIERRRVVGEVHLPDAIQAPAEPWRAPWPRGQHLTIGDVRRAFPGHARYWRDAAGTESSPEPHEPLICAGRGRGLAAECLVRVTLLSQEQRGRMGLMLPAGERFAGELRVRELRVRDLRFATGLEGLRVGARYVDIASRLERCELLHGDFEGLVCGLREAPGLWIDLEIRGDPRFAECVSEEWSSCPALDVATITDIVLAPR